MKKQIFYFALGIVMLFSACNVAYIPNRHNVPLMQEKKDASISISTTNLQGAYAVTDNIAVMGNVYFRENSWENNPDSNTTLNYDYQANRLLGELGVGYYKPLGENAVFELYGGGGLGNIGFELKDSNPIYDREYKANIQKLFIQPDIGFKSQYFDFVFSTRFSLVNFHDVDTTNYSISSLDSDNLYNLDKQPFLFLEPALTLRFGYKFIKAYTQGIVATKLNPEQINYRSFGVNVGIELDLGDLMYNR